MPICKTCGGVEYSKAGRCKNCRKKAKEKWRKKHPNNYYKSGRETYLKATFGINMVDYNTMFENQEGCCLICGKHQSNFKRALHVDHDHKTGKIRSLLCSVCNTQLGVYENRKEEFENYLERYKQ